MHRALNRLVARALLLVIGLALAGAALAVDKKGIGLGDRSAAERIEALQVGWYYTWTPHPMSARVAAEFVPMVWGGHRLKDHLQAMRQRGCVPTLLAINEPDHVDQANMSVQDVVRLWPELAALAERVSTPATATAENGWAQRFDELRRRDGLKADFMAIHLYGPPDVDKFLRHLDAIHARFGMPIWITEFAVADWDAGDQPGSNRYSEAQVIAFMNAVLPELERRDWVERYAWFGAGRSRAPHEKIRTSMLFDADGRLTDLGRVYASFRSAGAKTR